MNKQEFKNKTQEVLNQLDARIEELKTGIANVADDAKEEYNQQIEKLKGLKAEMAEKLAKFDEIAESKWDVVKESASNFFSQVGDAWKENYGRVSEAFKKGSDKGEETPDEGQTQESGQ